MRGVGIECVSQDCGQFGDSLLALRQPQELTVQNCPLNILPKGYERFVEYQSLSDREPKYCLNVNQELLRIQNKQTSTKKYLV